MAEVTLNGRRVFDATITLTATGVSWLEASVDAATAMTGKGTLVAPGLTFVGTIDSTSSGAFQEKLRVRVYAGAGGLRSSIGPQHYRGLGGIPIGVPLADLLKASGETLATDADASLTARVLQSWARPAGRIDTALRDLIVTQGGGEYRIDETGKLWVGTVTYPEQTIAHQLIEHNTVHRTFTIASERLSARPGRTFRGQRISEVRFEISAGKTRTVLVYGNNLPTTIRESIERFVDHKIDATKFYAATVVAQNADGTLEIKPDDIDKIAPLSKVPIRYGLPGVTAEVLRGARVRVSFDNGDREKPIASLWEPDSSTLVSLSFDGGSASVARVGDAIDCGTLYITIAGGFVTAVNYVAPGGVPLPTGVPLALSGVVSPNGVKVLA
jgi:hypothetical protein